jgi:hypothetical protein
MESLAPIIEQLRAIDRGSVRDGVSNHFLEVLSQNGEIVLGGNREGLVWLALQCVELAICNVPGTHYHLDERSMADRADLPLVIRVSPSES